MDPGVIAALVGVPTSIAAAAIAYPVGRGVARRQAEDQHVQWLRTQRREASSRLTDAATSFIESAAHVWEAVARPEYAHTRRRDIESRKRLDPALYEPLKAALREMHNALTAVALHGPEEVTAAGQDLYDAAMDMTGELLHLDAACVERSAFGSALHTDGWTEQRIQTSMDDLDTAYARLAAPIGLPEFSAHAEATLRTSAVITDLVRLAASLDDPPTASAVLDDLRRATTEYPEFRPFIEPFLALSPVLELGAMVRAVEGGQQIDAAQQLAAVSAAVSAMLGVLVSLRDLLQDPLPADVDPDQLPQELSSLVGPLMAVTHEWDKPLQVMHEIQQHLALGDELAASPPDPAIAFFAGAAWTTQLTALGTRAVEQIPPLHTLVPRLNTLLAPLFEYFVRQANADVDAAREKLIQARIAFLDAARDAIGADAGS
ncbi:hypothetical protein [Streptomyces violaceusniger]|uniref:Uncharacterized protein n=1 Tax=Streptomyces violaceusniger TaxID=68280 RepID=A0A4D4LMN3_STRVO|nr:hypothetical protein SVIO_111830 [Streptomyces violaceusniger]